MSSIMQKRGLTAALIVGPDWPLLDVSAHTGCDAVVARHLEAPQQHNLVFTQAPPGLCGCLISTSLMRELSERTRLSTVGGLLVYQPQAPQHDPIARSANVQIDHRVSRSRIRATFDSPRCRRRLRAALQLSHDDADLTPADLVDAITKQHLSSADELPQHVILELCCYRTSSGLFSHTMGTTARREPLSLDLARRIFSQVAKEGDCVLTLGGAGDPLLHEDFDRIVRLAKEAGVRGVHVRTELLADRSTLDRLLGCGVDVVSVDLHADRAVTYQQMMGVVQRRLIPMRWNHLSKPGSFVSTHRYCARPRRDVCVSMLFWVPCLRELFGRHDEGRRRIADHPELAFGDFEHGEAALRKAILAKAEDPVDADEAVGRGQRLKAEIGAALGAREDSRQGDRIVG